LALNISSLISVTSGFCGVILLPLESKPS
jgi:uncharacterized membrane protein